MKKPEKRVYVSRAGDHLRNLVKLGSFGGLFISLIGTGLIWAGSDSFQCPPLVWQICLLLNIVLSFAIWIAYIPFRNTDRLLGNGVLGLFIYFTVFWLFGFSSFYFYFMFAPMNIWVRFVALGGFTAAIIHRAYVICFDIKSAFEKDKSLLNRMYVDEGKTITFTREAVGYLEKSRPDRNPFKSYHLYVVMLLTPFVLVLNRILTPIIGDGNSVFIVTSFCAIPLVLWGLGTLVQFVVTMIYYPIKLQKETGKPVLMKNW